MAHRDGVHQFIDFTKSKDVLHDVQAITGAGAHAVIVMTDAYVSAADMLRPGGALCCVGISPGKAFLQTPIAGIVIKGLRILGNLVDSLSETLKALKFVQDGKVKVNVKIGCLQNCPKCTRSLKCDTAGRVVLQVA